MSRSPWALYNQVGPATAEVGVVEKRFEIFSPPNLFRGPRPRISSAPASAKHGTTFTIGTPDAMQVESVVLVRPGSATHATDFDQRLVELKIVGRTATSLKVVAPPNSSIAPTGTYMLFLNKGTVNGPIPSVARFVTVKN